MEFYRITLKIYFCHGPVRLGYVLSDLCCTSENLGHVCDEIIFVATVYR
jgi:hypothetical protein